VADRVDGVPPGVPARRVDGATPGVPADGTNKFLVNLENWRGEEATPSPGPLNVYVYHPEQLSQWGDHFMPTGQRLKSLRSRPLRRSPEIFVAAAICSTEIPF